MIFKKKLMFRLLLLVLFLFCIVSSISLYFISLFFIDAHYKGIIAEIVIDTSVLKSLRSNDINKAINILDTQMATNMINLSNHDGFISSETKKDIEKVLKLSYEYRKEYNVVSSSDTMEHLLDKSLEHIQESQGNKVNR